MRILILLVLVGVVTGCQSLPAAIATRAAERSKYCVEAADMTVAALCALGYEARAVDGEVDGAEEWHSWVEYYDGDCLVILDPFALCGLVEIPLDSYEAGLYTQRVFIVSERGIRERTGDAHYQFSVPDCQPGQTSKP